MPPEEAVQDNVISGGDEGVAANPPGSRQRLCSVYVHHDS